MRTGLIELVCVLPSLPVVFALGLFESSSLTSRDVATAKLCADAFVSVPLSVTTCTNAAGQVVDPAAPGVNAALLTCTTTTSDVLLDNSCVGPEFLVVISLIVRICLCISGGALTPSSLVRVNDTIKANGPAIQTLTTTTGGSAGYTANSLLNYIADQEPAIVSAAWRSDVSDVDTPAVNQGHQL